MGRRGWGAALALLLAGACAAPAQGAFDVAAELQNYSKTTERFRYVSGTPEYQLRLRSEMVTRGAQALSIVAADPERVFLGSLCWQRWDGCAGDVRFYDFVTRGAGISLPVLFTARNGATLSGHVWATAAGPAQRPGVVLTNGSVQAPEELYWSSAQALAKAGYVVLTYDPQGQGTSDTFGAGADALDGVPSQEGRPFYDGTEDALDFFLSTPGSGRYVPRRSCTSGTDHSAKQRRRVGEGRASEFNPLHALLDETRIGLTGQSLGAAAVSYVGQIDPRVKAVVALDDLRDATGGGPACPSGSSPRPARPADTKPALGISNDYGIVPTPNLSQPDPDAKTTASRALSADGVDTGELVVRGGTHFESAFIPNPAFAGTLRGNDLVAWYLVAWMDKYVKGDPSADARLLTDRWHRDPLSAKVDPNGDGNVLSTYHRSRLDVAVGEGRYRCEDLRTLQGCGPLAPDGGPEPYSVLAVAQAREAAPGVGPGADAARPWTWSTGVPGGTGAPPAATGAATQAQPLLALPAIRLRLGS